MNSWLNMYYTICRFKSVLWLLTICELNRTVFCKRTNQSIIILTGTSVCFNLSLNWKKTTWRKMVVFGSVGTALWNDWTRSLDPGSKEKKAMLRKTLMREIPSASLLILPFMVSHTRPMNWWGMTNTRMSASLLASTRSGTANWTGRRTQSGVGSGLPQYIKLIITECVWAELGVYRTHRPRFHTGFINIVLPGKLPLTDSFWGYWESHEQLTVQCTD